MYSGCTIFAMLLLSCDLPASVVSLPFINFPGPRGIVKSPLYAHLRILPKEEDHPGMFCLLVHEYCKHLHLFI